MPMIDAFRLVASQLVMLSHLVTYGPLPLAAREIIPGTIDWIYGYGRISVQVFLVISGFLAARSLLADGAAGSPLRLDRVGATCGLSSRMPPPLSWQSSARQRPAAG